MQRQSADVLLGAAYPKYILAQLARLWQGALGIFNQKFI
jgi:hypothetical protein